MLLFLTKTCSKIKGGTPFLVLMRYCISQNRITFFSIRVCISEFLYTKIFLKNHLKPLNILKLIILLLVWTLTAFYCGIHKTSTIAHFVQASKINQFLLCLFQGYFQVQINDFLYTFGWAVDKAASTDEMAVMAVMASSQNCHLGTYPSIACWCQTFQQQINHIQDCCSVQNHSCLSCGDVGHNIPRGAYTELQKLSFCIIKWPP